MKLKDQIQIECLGEDYNQLIGALGVLHNAREIKFTKEMYTLLKKMCHNVDHEKCSELKKKYRAICVKKGLIEIGLLFSQEDSDCLNGIYE